MNNRLRCLTQLRVLALGVMIMLVFSPAYTRSAAAHPLGNFTVNLFSSISVQRDSIGIMYVVDKAEIPTFQEFGATMPQGTAQTDYLNGVVPSLVAHLRLNVDGRPTTLDVVKQTVQFSGRARRVADNTYRTPPCGDRAIGCAGRTAPDRL